ncbi:hypothetical protein V8E51_013784, partial [Hyaloscypha variabilis]
QHFFPLFSSGKKQRLGGDFDAFARDHAPLFAMDEVKRQYAIASDAVEKALNMATAGRADPWDDDDEPTQHAVIQELKERKELITKGEKLRNEVVRVLDIMESYSTKVDEKSMHLRRQISAHVAKILPGARDLLEKIDLQIQGELTRLHNRNEQLVAENAVLKAQTGSSNSSNDVRDLMEKLQGRLGETDKEKQSEYARLKQAEADLLMEKGRWEHTKESFEDELKRLQQQIENYQAALRKSKETIEDSNRKKDATLSQKAEVGKQLSKALRDVQDEQDKTKEARNERDRQQSRLQTTLAEFEEFKQAQNASIDKLKREKSDLRIESGERQAKIEELQASAQTLQDQIEQLTSDKKSLQGDKQTHTDRIDKLEQEKKELSTESEKRQTKINHLEESARRLQGQIDQLKSDKQRLEGDVRSRDGTISRLEISQTQLQDRLDSITDIAHRKSNRISQLHSGNMRLKRIVLNKNTRILEKDQLISQMQAQGSLLEQQKSTLESSSNRLEVTNEQLENSVASWKKSAEDLAGEKLAWQTEKQQLEHAGLQLQQQLNNERAVWTDEKRTLEASVTNWTNAANGLNEEKIAWTILRTDMESAAASLVLTLFRSQDIWSEERESLQLHLDGASNAAIGYLNKCDVLTVRNAQQTQQLQHLHGELLNTISDRNTANQNLEAMANARDTANGNLTAMTKERNDAQTSLKSMTEQHNSVKSQRDDLQKELANVKNDLITRTSEKNTLQDSLNSMTEKRDTLQASLNSMTSERDNLQGDLALVTKQRDDQINDLNVMTEERDYLGQELHASLESFTQLQEEFEAQENILEQARNDRDTWEQDYHEVVLLNEGNVEVGRELEKEHALCANKVDAEVHQALKQTYDTLLQNHSGCAGRLESVREQLKQLNLQYSVYPDKDKLEKLQAMDWEHIADQWVRTEVYQPLRDQFDQLQQEHSSCPDKTRLASLVAHDEGLWVAKDDHDILQKKFETIKTAHSTCSAVLSQLEKLQSEHSEGLCTGKAVHDSLQQRFDTMDAEHSTCPDKMEFGNLQKGLNDMTSNHGEGLCVSEAEQKKLQGEVDELQSNHGNGKCVDGATHITLKGRFQTLAKQHEKCSEIQKTYDALVAQHQECLSSDDVQQLRDTADQHQQCRSADDVQMLQDFHDRHGDCTPRASYDQLYGEHQTCGEKLAAAESLRPEFEVFKNEHRDCEAIAAQLGQLQEEHGRCGQRLRSGSAGGFQAPATPLSNLRISIPQPSVTGYTSPYARTPSSQSPSAASTFNQNQGSPTPGSVGQGTSAQSSMVAGTFGQARPSPTSPGSFQFSGTPRSQSSPAPGTFGPPLQQPQPVQRQYSFLISGELATGLRTSSASPAMIQLADAQLAEWNRRANDKTHWSAKSKVSHQRCVYTRVVAHLTKTQNPAASETPNAACAACIKKGYACVLIGDNGPVIVPLPESERSAGATPTSAGYFVK